ncbi:MAG: GGDEF domain-containing protein [Alphaproteobacteria bacterium]|nr:GGDEF domain-containing protein [Alphaproteobacteria bacterium]
MAETKGLLAEWTQINPSQGQPPAVGASLYHLPTPTTSTDSPYINDLTTEIRRLRAENAQLQEALFIDPKTRLNSEVAFKNRSETILEQKLSGRQSDTKDIALIRIDLDGFKPINDFYGHDSGDQYFKIFGQRMQNLFRQNDVLARFGGDEFAILVVDTDIKTITEKMKTIFEESKDWVFEIFGKKIAFRGFSYGISSTDELNLTTKISAQEARETLNRTADQRATHHKLRPDKAQRDDITLCASPSTTDAKPQP